MERLVFNAEARRCGDNAEFSAISGSLSVEGAANGVVMESLGFNAEAWRYGENAEFSSISFPLRAISKSPRLRVEITATRVERTAKGLNYVENW